MTLVLEREVPRWLRADAGIPPKVAIHGVFILPRGK